MQNVLVEFRLKICYGFNRMNNAIERSILFNLYCANTGIVSSTISSTYDITLEHQEETLSCRF